MLWHGLFLACSFLCTLTARAEVALPAIEQITLLPEFSSVRIQLDRPVPFRAVRVDRREVMIAFNGAKLSEKIRRQGEQGPLIREYTVVALQNNVVALMLTTDTDVGEIQTAWDESVNTLTVRLFPVKVEGPVSRKTTKQAAIKSKALSGQPRQSVNKEVASTTALPSEERKSTEKPKAPESQAEAPPVADKISSSLTPESGPKALASLESAAMIPLPPSSTEKLSGSEDDLLLVMNGDSCPEQTNFQEALRQCGKNNWREAFQLLNADLKLDSQNSCAEKEFYLRAHAYYKLNQQGEEGLYLEALSYFQEAISYFPNSIFMPYALTSVGKIYKALKNYAEAKGYFKIVLEKYKDYPGLPEVMFNLGHIYSLEKNVHMSIPIFKDMLTNFPDNRFTVEVKLELGKALYNYDQYSQALEMLHEVLAKEPRRAVDLEDMLMVMGNSYYQLGRFQESREALIRAFNIFPDADANPITLTRIGDIFRDTDQPGKATKIYQIVMDRYPGTDGCVISAIRQAELLQGRTEKENIYRMVITEYPRHPMAQLAVVKLSDLQFMAGEYRNSIETLRALLAENPKNLRAELTYIMQASFKGLLSEMIKADVYPEIIAMGEKESQLLNRFKEPEIFRMLGIAHLRGHLYLEAAELFEKAEKYFGTNCPPEHYFEYGMALQESGDAEQALKKLETYVQKAPQGEHAASAYFRMGRLMIDRKDGNGALNLLKKAEALTKEPSEKAAILRLTAEAHSFLGDYKAVARLLNELVNLLSSAPERNAGMLFDMYRQLGETYLKIKSNAEAVTAFEMALKYAGKDQSSAVLVQLGEALGFAGQGELAAKTYRQVVASEDAFWKSVANERLERMQVEAKIKTQDGANR